MPVWFITGRLGSGKSLIGVKRAQEYLLEGRPVATNMDLFVDQLVPGIGKSLRLTRLPDKPSAKHLNSLGAADDGPYDESKFGLLLLDELGSWLNSRAWNDKQRQPFIDFCIHARKLRWDIAFLVQDISMVDAQVRQALCEYLVTCKRTDRITIPGTSFKAPKMHVASVYYSDQPRKENKEETWAYKGKGLYGSYDTTQAFSPFYKHSTYSVLGAKYFDDDGEEEVPRRRKRKNSVFTVKNALAFVVITGVTYGGIYAFSRLSNPTGMLTTTAVDTQEAPGASGDTYRVSNPADFDAGVIGREKPLMMVEGQPSETDPISSVGPEPLVGFDYFGFITRNGKDFLLFENLRTGQKVTGELDMLERMGYELISYDYAEAVMLFYGKPRMFFNNYQYLERRRERATAG